MTSLNSSQSTPLATPCDSLGLTNGQLVTGILLRYLDPMMGLTHHSLVSIIEALAESQAQGVCGSYGIAMGKCYHALYIPDTSLWLR